MTFADCRLLAVSFHCCLLTVSCSLVVWDNTILLCKGRTIIFLDEGGGGGGGGGMKNIEKNCLQGLKRQNKLFANIICIKKKIVCIEVRETFFQFHFLIF